MLSSNAQFDEDGQAAIIRDLERHELLLSGGNVNDMGGGTPASANDQTVEQDGASGSPSVTQAELDAAILLAISALPTPSAVTYPIAVDKGGTGQITAELARFGIGAIRGVLATGAPWITGTPTWDVPAGVNRIFYQIFGGGGGSSGGGSTGFGTIGYVSATSGGSPNQALAHYTGGSGGGFGGIGFGWVDVVPGETLSMSIGAGGAGGSSGTPLASSGGNTTLTINSKVITAVGGGGGDIYSGSGSQYPGVPGYMTYSASFGRNLVPFEIPAPAGGANTLGIGVAGSFATLFRPAPRPAGATTWYGAGGPSAWASASGSAGNAGAVIIYY